MSYLGILKDHLRIYLVHKFELSNIHVNEINVGLVGNLLSKRRALTTLATTNLKRFVNGGTPQGRIISPLL